MMYAALSRTVAQQYCRQSIRLFLFLYQISNLIATEILRCEDVVTRVAVIEKWVAVADICRCLHNYNAVLEITSSLNRSSVFRLKKTWLKVSKQVCSTTDETFGSWWSLKCSVLFKITFLFLRRKHWLTSCRSWSHQRGGSKTWGRLWRSEFDSRTFLVCSGWIKHTCQYQCTMCLFFAPAVTLPACPIWECISPTWLSSRRERQTTLRTIWSTSQRWEW